MKNYNFMQNMWYVFKQQLKYKKSFAWRLPIFILCSIILPILAALIPTVIVGAIEKGLTIDTVVLVILGILALYTIINAIVAYMDNELTWDNTFARLYRCNVDIASKNITMDYANLEPNSGRLRYSKAAEAVMSNWVGLERMMKSTPIFLLNLCGIIVYIFFLSDISWVVLLILLLMTICNIGLSFLARNYQQKTNPELDTNYNKFFYFTNETVKTEIGKDIRIYKMQKWITNICNVLTYKLSSIYFKQGTINRLPSFSDTIFTILRDLLAYSILIQQVLNGEITIISFTFYLGIITGFTTMLNGLTEELLNITLASTRVNNYRSFMSYPDKFLREKGLSCSDMKNQPLSIRFENVSFKYPESDNYIIENLSFEIQPKEKIALVGVNGAGKTTIVKLLAGLYQPTSGDIYVGGKNLKELNILEYYELISIIFQDVETTSFSIAENISCKLPKDTDYTRINECLIKADLLEKVDSLPLKEKTFLTKTIEEDGIELSGGQKQKLMLCRALYKDAPILILDEPTAALDPIAEHDLYKKYNDLTQNKTSIFISHRLSSTQFCDYVYFLEHGKIIEKGTHSELMKLNGKYREMFDTQAQYYKEGKKDE